MSRAEPRRVPARDARAGRAARDPARRRATRWPRRAPRSSAGTRSTTPSPSTGSRSPGVVHPREVLTNAGGRAGDVLVLTKPLGAGTIATAIKRGLASPALVARGDRGHDDAERPRRRAGPRGGRPRAHRRHRLRPARPRPRAGLRLAAWRPRSTPPPCPAIDGVLELLPTSARWPAARERNRADADTFTTWADVVPTRAAASCCDAMTSGGLLAALPPERAAIDGWVVGRLVAGPPGSHQPSPRQSRHSPLRLDSSRPFASRLTSRYSICITSI